MEIVEVDIVTGKKTSFVATSRRALRALRGARVIRVREHDDDKTTGFVIGMVFAGAAAAALSVLGVMFLSALSDSGGQ